MMANWSTGQLNGHLFHYSIWCWWCLRECRHIIIRIHQTYSWAEKIIIVLKKYANPRPNAQVIWTQWKKRPKREKTNL